MDVRFHPAVLRELECLPPRERVAVLNAVEKLRAVGSQLPYPHSSAVRGGRLRELRPRAGRSPWRALYVRVEDWIWILAIGPEAEQDRRGFERAGNLAEQRLEEVLDQP